jgi:polysaccharide pyruvyl transferase WcaK-like protein
MLDRVDGILLRDRASESFIRQIGVTAKADITADIAFLSDCSFKPRVSLEKGISYVHSPRVLFVIPRRFHNRAIWKGNKYVEKYRRYVDSIGRLADLVVEEMGGTPVFLPFSFQDVKLYPDILQTMTHRAKSVVINDPVGISFAFSMFQKADMVVGGQYHSIIFSILAEKPVVPIIYHPKCNELVKEANLTDIALQVGDGIEWPDVDLDTTEAATKLLSVFADRDKYAASLSRQRKKLQLKAAKNVQKLLDIFYSD